MGDTHTLYPLLDGTYAYWADLVWHLERRGSEQALDTNNDDDEANIYTIYTIYLQQKEAYQGQNLGAIPP